MLELLTIFLFLVIIIGGDRGGLSVFVLVGNIAIAVLSIVLMAKGLNAFVVLFASTVLFSGITIFVQNGVNKKTFSTAIAVIVLMFFVCAIVFAFCVSAKITGLNEMDNMEDDTRYLSSAVALNMRSIFIAAMIWGQLGAIVDTSISISTALHEIRSNTPDIDSKALYKSGMNIGKDILGTTVNTLTFVAMGESIMLSLLYVNYGYSMVEIINSKSFFQEVFSIIISCTGCILIIPLTSFIYARFSHKFPDLDYLEIGNLEKSKNGK